MVYFDWNLYCGFSCSPLYNFHLMLNNNKLVLNSVEKAYVNNWNWIVLVGDINYYSRFGFNKKVTHGVTIGNGLDNSRLLGLDIKDSYLEVSFGSLVEANQ